MSIDWEKLNKDNLFDNDLYEKILSIKDSSERFKIESKLLEIAKKFRVTGLVSDSYKEYKKNQKEQKKSNSVIEFR